MFDWVDVLGVPIAVAVIALVGTLIAQRTGHRAQIERELQIDYAREETIRSYLDRIADLVLEKQLTESDSDSAVRAIALARTQNALTTLDGPRKGLLIRFLSESQLIRNGNTVVSLNLADLTNSDLSGADLQNCNLSGSNLRDTYFYEADLRGSDFTNCVLTDADLRFCNLENCILTNGQIAQCAELVGAILPDGELATAQTLQKFRDVELEQWGEI